MSPSPSRSGRGSQCTFCFLAILLLPDHSVLNTGLPQTVHPGFLYFYYNKSNIFKFISIQLTASNTLPCRLQGYCERWCAERKVHHQGPVQHRHCPNHLPQSQCSSACLLVRGNVLWAFPNREPLPPLYRSRNRDIDGNLYVAVVPKVVVIFTITFI